MLHAAQPGVAMIAEESTAWPGVSRPTDGGGLGFTFKWNMGWMHDTLAYVEHEPVHRSWHHDELTFSLVYAWDENFVLPLSHDEVVHGKRRSSRSSRATRGSSSRRCARSTAHMWAHPGKQLLFMGGELAQGTEWSEAALARLARCSTIRCTRASGGASRPQPRLPGRAGALGGRLPPGGLRSGSSATRARTTCSRTRASRPTEPGCSSASSTSRRSCARAGGCRCRPPAAGGGAEHRRRATTAGRASATSAASTAVAEPLHGRPFSARVTLPPLATLWLVPASPGRQRSSSPSSGADVRLERVEQSGGAWSRSSCGRGPPSGAGRRRSRPRAGARAARGRSRVQLDEDGAPVVRVRHAPDEPGRSSWSRWRVSVGPSMPTAPASSLLGAPCASPRRFVRMSQTGSEPPASARASLNARPTVFDVASQLEPDRGPAWPHAPSYRYCFAH